MTVAGSLALLLTAACALAAPQEQRSHAELDVGAVSSSALVPRAPLGRELARRATDQAPRGYAPASVDCPEQRPVIRDGSSLSPEEREWLPRRRNQTVGPMRDLLRRIAIPGFDSERYLQAVETDPTALPNIGIAVSGGGYRAMLNGAGVLAAFDNRSAGSTSAGNLGGLLQSATYLSGLSGGGWLVGSIYTNNFTSVMDAIGSPNIWQFSDSILKGPEQYSLLQYYRNILDDVNRKRDAGFNTSITDYWGRMLSYQLVNARDGGPGYTFSSIANDSDFAAARTPLPFLVADARAPGETILMTNATVFDFSPWELGTSDAAVNGYAPLRFVGSRFEGGRLPSSASCVAGFDNAGFVMGTSSSLFNQVVLRLRDGNSRDRPSDVPGFIVDALTSVLQSVGERDDDIADWTPNPFRGWNPDRNPGAGSERLTLVDGGEDNQNIPYHPQLLTERAVDVIFSVDSSADTNYSWPNGSAPMNTYRRSLVRDLAPGSGFPVVPSTDSFLNLGLNTRPAFFGCDAGNRSSDAAAPLVVYLPNYPYLFASNISTFTLSLSNAERDAMVKNGWALATQLNGSRDADWPACVGCAMLARSFDRTRTTPPDKCRQCFDRYCWDGSINQTQPRPYVPRILGTPINVESNGAAHAAIPPPAASAALLATLLALLL